MLKGLLYSYFIILLILLIITYRNKRPGLRISIKVLTSLLFIAIAFLGFNRYTSSINYTYFIFAGLVFSALGDLLLGFTHNASIKNNTLLRDGIVTFSLTHITFIIGFNMLNPFTNYILLIIPLLTAGLFIPLSSPKFIDTGTVRLPLIIYSFLIITMLLTALNTAIPLIMAGAILFVVSDIILGFALLYGKKHPILPVFNLLLYYIGQLCLSLTLFK